MIWCYWWGFCTRNDRQSIFEFPLWLNKLCLLIWKSRSNYLRIIPFTSTYMSNKTSILEYYNLNNIYSHVSLRCILGTMISAFTACCCCKQNRSLSGTEKCVLCSSNFIIGLLQLLSTALLLVGWIWSCAYGIMFIGMSGKFLLYM